MKVTYNWLKDFVEIRMLPRVLADKLTMTGLEVTSLEEIDGDFVFEIEVTSNRPDCLSVIGIAREVAAITNSKFKIQKSKLQFKIKNFKKENYPLKIEIQNRKDCPLYTAKIIKDVKVGPSPDWLKRRLELVGCRSVNNVVDITNYILFEYGEPLHAFDLDKLVSQLAGYPVSPLEIIIRRAKKGEEIVTIDGIKKVLDEQMLVIASGTDKLANSRTCELANNPVAIAGIMGGKDTEVTESTKNILLEAAIFSPIVIRRARQKLGLQSESAYRFERGIDLEIVEIASWATVKLVQLLSGGRCFLAKSSGSARIKRKNIDLDVSTVNKILGENIMPPKIKKILNSLEFKTKTKARNNFTVEIPSHRPDVNLEIDLIEEIARIFGYENIVKSSPLVRPQLSVGQRRDLVSVIKNILVDLGLNEAITYSLMDKDLLSSFGGGGDAQIIDILNPLSKEQEILRPTLLPSLATCVADNLNQKQEYINIFEIANAFLGSSTQPKEELRLAIALCGIKSLCFKQGPIKEEVGFLHLKGILEVLFERLGISSYDFNIKDDPAYVAIYVQQEKIGAMARLQKNILDKLNIKNKDVFCLELSLERVLSYARMQKRFTPLPKYPAITRDISFIIKEDIAVKDILEAMQNRGRPILVNIKIVDYYKGKQIPPGYRGLTISCLYRSDERTLTEAEINPVHTLVCNVLTDTFDAKIR